MNKLLIAVVLAVLIGGGGIYYYNNVRGEGSVSDNGSKEALDKTEETQGPRTLQALLGLGQNLQCSFSSEGLKEGKMYISGKKVRGDFTVEDETSAESSVSMIQDGEWMYYWGSAMPQGMKMKLDLSAQADANASTGNQWTQVDPNVALDYNCDAWRVDASKFTPPANVEFVDLETQLQMMNY